MSNLPPPPPPPPPGRQPGRAPGGQGGDGPEGRKGPFKGPGGLPRWSIWVLLGVLALLLFGF
ncbi:MAG: hypothetical protein WCH93_12235, partial [Actinomycetota bacterium]